MARNAIFPCREGNPTGIASCPKPVLDTIGGGAMTTHAGCPGVGWGNVSNEASIRLSGPGVAGGWHGARPRRSLWRGPQSLRGGRRDVVTASLAPDVRRAG